MCVAVPRPIHKRPRSAHPLVMTKFDMLPPISEAPVAVVAKPITPEPAAQSPFAPSSKKSVDFAPVEATVAAYIPALSDLEHEEVSSVWYTPAELYDVKERARETSRRLRLRDLEEQAAAAAAAAALSSGSEGEADTSDGESEVLRRYRERCSVALRQSQLSRQQAASTSSDPQSRPSAAQQDIDDDDLACPRGFELRLSPLRQRNRALAHRATLEFARRQKAKRQQQGGDDENVDPSLHLALVASKLNKWSREVALSTGQGDFLDAYEVFRAVLPAPKSVEEISQEHRFPLGVKRTASASQSEQEERRVRRKVC